MPTPAPLLAGGRVLGTAHRHAVVPARNADVAAYAFAYLVLPPLVDFIRQKWVRDGRSRAPDQIQDAPPYLGDHHVRRGEAAHAHHRPLRQLLDEIDDGFVAALGRKSRGRAVGGAG